MTRKFKGKISLLQPDYEGKPPRSRSGKRLKAKVTIDLDASVAQLFDRLDMSYIPSHKSKSQVLCSNTICKRRKLIQMWTQNWQAYQYISERLLGGKLSEKMNKYQCPEIC